MEQNIIGTTIAALRREKGLTQDALAAQLGVSAQAVSKWENGLGATRKRCCTPCSSSGISS